MSFASLLGDVIAVDANGAQASVSSLDGKYLFLYFSAHWCPPCRGFTPRLADFYGKHHDAKNFEVVFVSSDKEENSFREYFSEMPWKALPYSDRDRKGRLSRKFGVNGIPSLVLLGPDGKEITRKGREQVTQDSEASSFPWQPKSLKDIVGSTFTGKAGQHVSTVELAGKYLGIYFSAHWCGPCRGFTPTLAAAYDKLKAAGKPFEIIFSSADHDSDSFDQYYKEMPWLAIPYDDSERREALNDFFEVEGIPTLVILDPEFKVVNADGVAAVRRDKNGESFPWAPKALVDIAEAGPGVLNKSPCAVMLAAHADPATKDTLRSAMEAAALDYAARVKESGKEAAVVFTYCDDARVEQAIRNFLANTSKEAALAFIDASSETKALAPTPHMSPADIRVWLQPYIDAAEQ
mmetsp:Transcript_23267/g.40039  ORF Transcript_23267/g.40039 Transcript_23267/m.40039 type:complete len:407 (-) Transcript_23267:435-1655(-)|eukprot:CAMPEP_0196661348 /NCGR_PEP_ID=MMETSP1086-20130531/43802_1 /TAXON_ID=77921 /ORGANISM="Cyanoptyche  gloeocystis , Strain SAG4.97" /LENGTH=406 /DNA_ID=CAMNT_0041996191 /DNA_START=82 /DNA_END=1302 /DNA_ORIENTATION=+